MFLLKTLLVYTVLYTTESHIVRGRLRQHNAHLMKEKCWGVNNAKLFYNINQASCKPRETLVELKSNSPNIQIYPKKVVIEQCGGGTCNGQYSCIPIQSENVSAVVRKYDTYTQESFCEIINLEKHTKCICGCPLQKNSCSPKQIFIEKECKCVCYNKYEEESCIQQGKKWNLGTCSCQCVEDLECSTGSFWVPGLCRCVAIRDIQSGKF